MGLFPPGFLGKTHNNKYDRAIIYKARIVNHALRHPKRYSAPLYRGIRNWEHRKFMNHNVVHKQTLSSFSKSFTVAKNFAGGKGGSIISLHSNKPIPSINFTSGNFQSEFGPGGKKYTGKNEYEVLLPPGTFELKGRRFKHSTPIYNVNFVPNRINTSYIHTQKQKSPPPHVQIQFPNKTSPKKNKSPNKTSPKKNKYVPHSVNSKGKHIFKGSKGGFFKLTSTGKKKYIKQI
jgi:hypothetical protein